MSVEFDDRAECGVEEAAVAAVIDAVLAAEQVGEGTGPEAEPAPKSGRSYTETPSKPEEGRPVAGTKGTTPEAGAEPATAGAKTDGSQAKPVGITPADKAADKGPPGPKAKP